MGIKFNKKQLKLIEILCDAAKGDLDNCSDCYVVPYKKELEELRQLFVCEGKADSTNEKDLRVCEVSNSLPLILGLDNPYPLRDVLERLKWATNYLLHEKNYDGHSYEELNQCVRRANEIIAMLNGNGC